MKNTDNSPILFIKFGKHKDLKKLINGTVYFSNAVKFREAEKKTGRGQGDAYEALLRFAAEEGLEFFIDLIGTAPVFCLSAITRDDCNILGNSDSLHLYLNPAVLAKIRHDFKKADTAAVFFSPRDFIQSIGNIAPLKHGYVNYFNLEPANCDYSFYDFIVRNPGKISTKNPVILYTQFQELDGTFHEKKSITKANLSNILFCKDTYFSDEKEYRFVLTNKRIDNPKEFHARFGHQKRCLISIDDLERTGIPVNSKELIQWEPKTAASGTIIN